MTIAPNTTPAAVSAAAEAAVADGTSLLPQRDAVLERLTEQLATVDAAPATLMIIGLLRQDDGWPTPPSTMAQVTALFARSVRGDDWLGSSGPAEFVVVVHGPVPAAETAAARLCASVSALGIPGLSASAGIAALAPGLRAGEVLRRATVSLSTARSRGVGTLITYREAD